MPSPHVEIADLFAKFNPLHDGPLYVCKHCHAIVAEDHRNEHRRWHRVLQ